MWNITSSTRKFALMASVSAIALGTAMASSSAGGLGPVGGANPETKRGEIILAQAAAEARAGKGHEFAYEEESTNRGTGSCAASARARAKVESRKGDGRGSR